jgi:hypothetical protein
METPATTTPVPMIAMTQGAVMVLFNQERNATTETVTTKTVVPTRAEIAHPILSAAIVSLKVEKNAMMETPTTTTPVPMSARTQVAVTVLFNQERTATTETISTPTPAPTPAMMLVAETALFNRANSVTMETQGTETAALRPARMKEEETAEEATGEATAVRAVPVRPAFSKSRFPLKQIVGLGARIKSTFST